MEFVNLDGRNIELQKVLSESNGNILLNGLVSCYSDNVWKGMTE